MSRPHWRPSCTIRCSASQKFRAQPVSRHPYLIPPPYQPAVQTKRHVTTRETTHRPDKEIRGLHFCWPVDTAGGIAINLKGLHGQQNAQCYFLLYFYRHHASHVMTTAGSVALCPFVLNFFLFFMNGKLQEATEKAPNILTSWVLWFSILGNGKKKKVLAKTCFFSLLCLSVLLFYPPDLVFFFHSSPNCLVLSPPLSFLLRVS